MIKPETRLLRKLRVAIQARYPESFSFKVHGSPFQDTGLPDLVCCIQGRFVGIEAKMPGKVPTKIQYYKLDRIHDAGGIAIWGSSIEAILDRLETELNVQTELQK